MDLRFVCTVVRGEPSFCGTTRVAMFCVFFFFFSTCSNFADGAVVERRAATASRSFARTHGGKGMFGARMPRTP